MKQKSETNRVEVGGAGIGEVSDAMIAARARTLAVSDGREEAHDGDLREARAQLAGRDSGMADAELSIPESERPDGGVPPADTGTRAPRLEMEDENNLAAAEVEEGIAEADIDTRRKSRHDM